MGTFKKTIGPLTILISTHRRPSEWDNLKGSFLVRRVGWQMRDPTENGAVQIETVSPYAPKKGAASGKADQLDLAGQSILRLLHKAAVDAAKASPLAEDRRIAKELRRVTLVVALQIDH